MSEKEFMVKMRQDIEATDSNEQSVTEIYLLCMFVWCVFSVAIVVMLLLNYIPALQICNDVIQSDQTLPLMGK